jgi:polar amino acid transport system substrate-binding protein
MKQTLLLGLILFFTFGCTQTHSKNSGSPSILRVGISTNSPPIAYKENGKFTGMEVDFAKGLAQFTGRKLKIIQIKWEDQITSLISGKTDIIMSGMSITDSRKYRIAFSNPYMLSGQISLIRLTDRNTFQSGATDLLNPSLKIGTIKGTTGDLFIQQIRANGKRIQFDTSAKAVKNLLSHDLDAFIYDLPGNLYLASKYESKGLTPVLIPLTKEYLAWGVRKNDTELLNNANQYLDSLKQEGTLLKTIQHWVPYYKP